MPKPARAEAADPRPSPAAKAPTPAGEIPAPAATLLSAAGEGVARRLERPTASASRIDVIERAPPTARSVDSHPGARPPNATSSSALRSASIVEPAAPPQPSASPSRVPAGPSQPAVAPPASAASPSSRRLHPAAAAESPADANSAAASAARAAASRAADLRVQAQAATASRLDDQRLSQLHGALVAERRRLKQPGKVSKEALGASLRETESKLQKQYGDKAIDFHVVVKDGKAVVKPVIG